MDQELPKATGQHVLCFLGAPITHTGHHDLAPASSVHPVVNVSEFPPVLANFDLQVCLVLDDLLGPLFYNLRFRKGSECSHGAKTETAATSTGSTEEELLH